MSNSDHIESTNGREVDKGRRRLLFWIPVGVCAGFAATMATAAFRYLRPTKAMHEAAWNDVAPLAELKGDKPLMKSIVVEHEAGWASALEEHFVYVLPQKNNEVLSSNCPHEGCNVAWNADANQFFCPCHASFFNADGDRLSGPAQRGLDPLPTRVENGTLQVQYQTYVNNTGERIVRE